MPEVRLIDANDLLEILCFGCTKYSGGICRNEYGRCAEYTIIKLMPTIEAEPVVHSAWTVHDPDFNSYQCKNCGLAWMLNDGNPIENEMNFCPNCGAKMDGGGEQE